MRVPGRFLLAGSVYVVKPRYDADKSRPEKILRRIFTTRTGTVAVVRPKVRQRDALIRSGGWVRDSPLTMIQAASATRRCSTKCTAIARRAVLRGRFKSVVWLPKRDGRTLRVTTVNGVADQLARISRELDALPKRFMKYLVPLGGTYRCRTIAGTKRKSFHAYGAAIDINVKFGNYWRWTRPDRNGRIEHKNQMPFEIVRIFERHGFIWGGKWYHYDTMHFEYRPEIISHAKKRRAGPVE